MQSFAAPREHPSGTAVLRSETPVALTEDSRSHAQLVTVKYHHNSSNLAVSRPRKRSTSQSIAPAPSEPPLDS